MMHAQSLIVWMVAGAAAMAAMVASDAPAHADSPACKPYQLEVKQAGADTAKLTALRDKVRLGGLCPDLLALIDAGLRSKPPRPSPTPNQTPTSTPTAPPAPPAGTSQILPRCTDKSCPKMVVLPAGSFEMGAPPNETGMHVQDGPVRSIRIARSFAVAIHEVTVAEFRIFASETKLQAADCFTQTGRSAQASWANPGFSQSPDDPVACVSWEDAKDYADWLSAKTHLHFRLLSDAEWEYAARAGTTTPFYWGRQPSHEQANYGTDRPGGGGWATGRDAWLQTAPVGSFPANSFGLFDMLGNVHEWIEDCFEERLDAGQPTDGSAFEGGECATRGRRGGSWSDGGLGIRSAQRNSSPPNNHMDNVGFRLALTLEGGL